MLWLVWQSSGNYSTSCGFSNNWWCSNCTHLKAKQLFHLWIVCRTSIWFLHFSTVKNTTRCDIVCEVYVPGSLKTGTHEKRGTSRKRRVEPGSKIPKDWGDFLKREENKEELFSFLAKESLKVQDKGQIISTLGDKIVVKNPADVTLIAPCNHEEADSWIFVHVSGF